MDEQEPQGASEGIVGQSASTAGLGLVAILRRQADEIAKAGLPGWGNTMTDAADEIEALRYSLHLDEELIGMIQQIISRLNNRPMPNRRSSGAGRSAASDCPSGTPGWA